MTFRILNCRLSFVRSSAHQGSLLMTLNPSTSVMTRQFSISSRLKKYATMDQVKKAEYKRRKTEKLGLHYEGVNLLNTDVNKRTDVDPENMSLIKPIQHPRNLDADDTGIISYKVPPKNLTPYYHVPDQALLENDDVLPKEMSPTGSRLLEACILGAPNAGKSSLMNYLIGKNVSAVSNKYNTTDEATKGIVTDFESNTQLIFLDTPGVTKVSNSLRSNLLVSRAWDVIDN